MSKKIGVLQVIDQLGTGGAETLQYTMAAAIDRERFDWHVCALRPSSQESAPLAGDLRALGVPVTVFRQRNAYDVATLLKLARYIRSHRIDLIHTHLAGADVAGRITGFITRRPVVSTIHMLKGDFPEAPRRRQWLVQWTARLMCARLVVVARNLRDEVAEWFGVPLRKVVVIPNGVDTGKFRKSPGFNRESMRRALTGGDYPIITNVGRLFPQKAQHHLIEAATAILETLPTARFVLAGDGPLRAGLEALAQARGLGDHVLFLGFRDDVSDILAASDLFVLTSEQEGLPLAVLEALSLGCPVVSTAVGGVPEVVREGITGRLIPPGDTKALTEAILAAFADKEESRRMAANGQRLVKEEYNMHAWARKWEKLYRHVLAGARG